MVRMSPAALSERQRALFRGGLIKSEAGRGPGSGVRATPQSVAMLLISLLATDSLSEAEERTRLVASLKSRSKRCPLTGKRNFGDALSAILSSEELAARIFGIAVDRTAAATWAAFAFPKRPKLDAPVPSDNFQDSEFGEYPKNIPGLRVTTNLAINLDELAELIEER